MIKNVLVLIPVQERHKQLLESKMPNAQFTYTTSKDATKDEIQAAHVIIGNPRSRDLRGSANLEFIQLETAGAEHYTKEGIITNGAVLANATGAYGLAISEYLLGMLLMLFKKFHLYRDQQRTGLWTDLGDVKAVEGSTVLIVGLGDIGGNFAKKVKAMGAKTIGIRRVGVDKPDYLDELHLMSDLDQLLPLADVVALSLPATPETYQLMNRERFSKLKQGAVVLNVGRGNAIDMEALCDALETGKVSGVGLDVTDPEPLPSDHRLWQLPGVFITPHVSGGHHLPETFENIVKISAENLEAFVKGAPIHNVVDFSTGYRKL